MKQLAHACQSHLQSFDDLLLLKLLLRQLFQLSERVVVDWEPYAGTSGLLACRGDCLLDDSGWRRDSEWPLDAGPLHVRVADENLAALVEKSHHRV